MRSKRRKLVRSSGRRVRAGALTASLFGLAGLMAFAFSSTPAFQHVSEPRDAPVVDAFLLGAIGYLAHGIRERWTLDETGAPTPEGETVEWRGNLARVLVGPSVEPLSWRIDRGRLAAGHPLRALWEGLEEAAPRFTLLRLTARREREERLSPAGPPITWVRLRAELVDSSAPGSELFAEAEYSFHPVPADLFTLALTEPLHLGTSEEGVGGTALGPGRVEILGPVWLDRGLVIDEGVAAMEGGAGFFSGPVWVGAGGVSLHSPRSGISAWEPLPPSRRGRGWPAALRGGLVVRGASDPALEEWFGVDPDRRSPPDNAHCHARYHAAMDLAVTAGTGLVAARAAGGARDLARDPPSREYAFWLSLGEGNVFVPQTREPFRPGIRAAREDMARRVRFRQDRAPEVRGGEGGPVLQVRLTFRRDEEGAPESSEPPHVVADLPQGGSLRVTLEVPPAPGRREALELEIGQQAPGSPQRLKAEEELERLRYYAESPATLIFKLGDWKGEARGSSLGVTLVTDQEDALRVLGLRPVIDLAAYEVGSDGAGGGLRGRSHGEASRSTRMLSADVRIDLARDPATGLFSVPDELPESPRFTDSPSFMPPAIEGPPCPAPLARPTLAWRQALGLPATGPEKVAYRGTPGAPDSLPSGEAWPRLAGVRTLVIGPEVEVVAGFISAERILVAPRAAPLDFVGTFISRSLSLPPEARAAGVRILSVHHPLAETALAGGGWILPARSATGGENLVHAGRLEKLVLRHEADSASLFLRQLLAGEISWAPQLSPWGSPGAREEMERLRLRKNEELAIFPLENFPGLFVGAGTIGEGGEARDVRVLLPAP